MKSTNVNLYIPLLLCRAVPQRIAHEIQYNRFVGTEIMGPLFWLWQHNFENEIIFSRSLIN